MARKTSTKVNSRNKKQEEEPQVGFRLRYVLVLIVCTLVVFSLLSHNKDDIAVIDGGDVRQIENWVGMIGAYISKGLFYLIGLTAYPITFFFIICGFRPFLPVPVRRKGYISALIAILFGSTLLFAMWPRTFIDHATELGLGRADQPEKALTGGVVGQVLVAPVDEDLRAGFIRHYIGTIGTTTVASTFLGFGLIFVFIADWKPVCGVIIRRYMDKQEPASKTKAKPKPKRATKKKPEVVEEPEEEEEIEEDEEPKEKKAPWWRRMGKGKSDEEEFTDEDKDSVDEEMVKNMRMKRAAKRKSSKPEKITVSNVEEVDFIDSVQEEAQPKPKIPTASAARSTLSQPLVNPQPAAVGGASRAHSAPMDPTQAYTLPPLSLIAPVKEVETEDESLLSDSSYILQSTLESFKVKGQVTGVVSGPRVSRFEVSLEPGVKVEKVSSIANNIAMELSAESIRILAPIPGKNAVGVEVPNSKPSPVFFRKMLEDEKWAKTKHELPIVLGKDVSGEAIMLDLAKAPHLLIAGATGSGKSVCMNTLIMSMLMRYSPDELQLIMVDPKVVELEMYRPLPHLITPVVNDANKVPLALRWGVNEMEKRYRMLAKVKAKNLKGFNGRPADPEPVLDADNKVIPPTLPYLVLIIDELADVMMTDAKSDVETSIAKIAQKGRAAGIHLVIATQRPSTNIITGVIKANLPTRIAFRVGSLVDSRVILDQKGAEKLLGQGDMLYVPPGASNIERIQGAFVDDRDIQEVVDFCSAQRGQVFDNKVVQSEEETAAVEQEAAVQAGDPVAAAVQKYLQPGDNDLIKQSLEIIFTDQKVSTSYIQRRLKIGYNRAAEIIDALEERGIVSAPLPGGSKREILVTDGLEETI